LENKLLQRWRGYEAIVLRLMNLLSSTAFSPVLYITPGNTTAKAEGIRGFFLILPMMLL